VKPGRGLVAVAATALLFAAGCGGGGGGGKPRLVVSAASSLTEALGSCSADFPEAKVRLSFAGSDELAAQIRRGVRPDVFAVANTKLPDDLYRDGLLEKPLAFASNELVLAVPADSGKVRSLGQLRKPGLKIAVGSDSVPVGSYAREVLSRLPVAEREQISRNVRSREPDVKGVVGKLTQRAVDAGFVYATDVEATKGELRAIRLSQRLRPTVAYGAGVLQRARQPDAAGRYVRGLRSGACAAALRDAGFGPPPAQ
jgi:molybdate transport system substrate-binding protein